MNTEDYERGMDAAMRHSEIIHRTDLWDSVQDARSEARYEYDPQAEPERAYGVSYER